MMPTHKIQATVPSVELEKIRPGMSREDMERARQEIIRVAADALKGQ